MFNLLNINKIILGVHKDDHDAVLNILGKNELIQIVKERWNYNEIFEADSQKNYQADIITPIESAIFELEIEAVEKFHGQKIIPDFNDSQYQNDLLLLKSITSEINCYKNFQIESSARKGELEKRLAEVEQISSIYENLEILEDMEVCSYALGTVSLPIGKNESADSDFFYVSQCGNYILGIALKNHHGNMLDYLKKYGFEDRLEHMRSGKNLINLQRHIREEIIHTEESANLKSNDYHNKKKEWIKVLETLYNRYKSLEIFQRAKRKLLFSDHTVFINGWALAGDMKKIEKILRENCARGFVVIPVSKDTYSPEDAPVRLSNNRFFRSFEVIVKNAGIPNILEKDPTPIASIAFAVMFGAMFGDIGQGIILVLTGILLKHLSKKKTISPFMADAGTILIFCGVSATLFGFLYGSVFSYEHIPALWLHPMEQMMDLFFAAIMMGAALISIGLIINIINTFSFGHKTEAIFGTKGIAGFVIYAGTLILFIRYLKFNFFPERIELVLIMALPLSLFMIRNIIGYLFLNLKNPFPHGIFEYIVESIVEIIEMFSSFLGNSISFIRAGAFALSHAGLSNAVYTLAKIVNPEILSVGSLSVIVIGNVFIILLEGLVCTIQSMRLEYYEFFGKFFHGDGKEFQPFSLKNNYFALEAKK